MTGRARCGVMLLVWACAACGDEPTPAIDSDGDDLSDADEAKLGTDPNQVDSDLDGVPDYSDDADGDGVSNADEIAAGTATPPSRSGGTPPSGGAGAASDEDTPPGGDEGGAGSGAQDVPADGDAPGDQPSDTPDDPPAGTPDRDSCQALREKCGAGDGAACAMLDLDSGCAPPADAPRCDELWALCTKNQARACEAFVTSCDLPGCEDLKAACDGGSQPLCTLHERECAQSTVPGDGDEPAYCADLRAACDAGSQDACTLVERDCSTGIDCGALELECKEAGGVGEACEQLVAHCG